MVIEYDFYKHLQFLGADQLNMGDSPDADMNVESDNGKLPEWVEVLSPVRHLPTNVGSRIRKRVHDALEKSPPAWARKRLERSISKQVYKGNAAGPTKRAVLSVLNDFLHEHVNEQSQTETKEKHNLSVPDITLKLCRIVLRDTASLLDSFCKLFPRSLMNSSLENSKRFCESSPSIFHHLDFRPIDSRLAVGTYRGSHEAFFRDVQEVLDVVRKLNEYSESSSVSAEASREVENILKSVDVSEICGASWNSGICKVCSVDKDDDVVLLCDICEGEYHIYCLEPPLHTVPDEEWYCPLCVSPETVAKDGCHVSELPEKLKEEESETSEDQYVPCEVCGGEGSSDDMLCCHQCKISFVHSLCYLSERQVSKGDVTWACQDCEGI
uniref:Histone acetyltransferase n=1 Tax=Opuntia streptacantha TaxID=393608 RepID=A0A7C9CE72_OPUST